MTIPDNVAWLWHPRHPEPEGPIPTMSPEGELDGDRLWIWVGGGEVRMTWEEVSGEEAVAAGWLIAHHPELSDMAVSEDSPNGRYETLSEAAATSPPVTPRIVDVEAWFHGTSTVKLDSILTEGIHGEMTADGRAWRNVPDPDFGVVYLTSSKSESMSYARKASLAFGGHPAVIEISASAISPENLIEDRDFRHTHEWTALCAGEMPGIEQAQASFTCLGKVGHVGRIEPDMFVTVHAEGFDGINPVVGPGFR